MPPVVLVAQTISFARSQLVQVPAIATVYSALPYPLCVRARQGLGRCQAQWRVVVAQKGSLLQVGPALMHVLSRANCAVLGCTRLQKAQRTAWVVTAQLGTRARLRGPPIEHKTVPCARLVTSP